MTRLHRMSYNLPASKDNVSYRWRGCATCLAPHRRFALSFLRIFYGKPASRPDARPLRISPSSGTSLPCCSIRSHMSLMRRLANAWAFRGVRCGVGASGGPRGIFPWRTPRAEGASPLFPPLDHALVKAVACELVAETKQPLSRQSLADVRARVCKGLGKPISRSTVWRILDTDAIKPWRYKYWIFPRDPHFAEKAGLLLDLYAGMWQGQPLGPHDHILSADEKTGIAPFGRLVKQVLAEEPYRSGERLFWIVDNGSSHRGTAARKRLRHLDSRIILVHTPVHASWLNQVEIYFSIIQRKVLTPNDFADLEAVRLRLALYEELSNHHPTPFQWKFDRTKLAALLAKIEARQKALAEAQLNWLEEAA